MVRGLVHDTRREQAARAEQKAADLRAPEVAAEPDGEDDDAQGGKGGADRD